MPIPPKAPKPVPITGNADPIRPPATANDANVITDFTATDRPIYSLVPSLIAFAAAFTISSGIRA